MKVEDREQLLFNEPKWKMLSNECHDFIASCVQVDIKSRPTAESLLKHPFITAFQHQNSSGAI